MSSTIQEIDKFVSIREYIQNWEPSVSPTDSEYPNEEQDDWLEFRMRQPFPKPYKTWSESEK